MLFCVSGTSSSSHRVYNIHPTYYPRLYPDIERINRTDINTTINFKSLAQSDAGFYSCYFQGVRLNGTVHLTVLPPTPRPTTARPTPPRPSTTIGPTTSIRSPVSNGEESEDGEGFSSTYGPIPHDGDGDGDGATKSRASSQSATAVVIVILLVLLAFGLAVWWWLRQRNARPTGREFRLLRYFRS